MTGLLADVFAARASSGPVYVVIDGADGDARGFAGQLADALARSGQPHLRLTEQHSARADAWPRHRGAVVIAHGPRWRANAPVGGWDVIVQLRAAPGAGENGHGNHERQATVVIDYRDPRWPVIRDVHPDLAGPERWYLSEGRAFFSVRAATWDTKFGDDGPAYAAAVAEAGLSPGQRVLDVGCGTGRALPALKAAVGQQGTVIGVDMTPDMLHAAAHHDRAHHATLLLGDARRLPLAAGSVHAVFAAGLVQHLPNPKAGLGELARVTRPAGTLVIFHPSGRAALAARHGRALRPDEPLAEHVLRSLLTAAGWRLTRYHDPPHRFLAIAQRSA